MDTTTISEISAATGKSVSSCWRLLRESQHTPGVRNGRGRAEKYYALASLSDELRLAVSLYRTAARRTEGLDDQPESSGGDAVPDDMAGMPACVLNGALAKGCVVRLYLEHMRSIRARHGDVVRCREAFVTAYNGGAAGPYPDLFAKTGPITVKSLERWELRIRRSGSDPATLVDKRGRRDSAKSSISDDQADILTNIALSENRFLDAEIIRSARKAMRLVGIPDPQSDDTFRRFIDQFRTKNYAHWVFCREGWKALNEKCLFHVTRDYDAIEVGDILFADGHTMNFEIVNPYTGKPKRMTMVLWYDMKSNYPLGWDIMPSENTQSILYSLYRAILNLGKLPRVVYLDNGRAFRGQFFTGVNDFRTSPWIGLFERLGIKTIFAWPYHPETKPIEGFFRIFSELERRAVTYTGTCIENKPPRMRRNEKTHLAIYEAVTQGRAPTVIDTHMAIAAWVDEYALRAQRGHLKGRCPLQVFSEGRGPGFSEEERFQLRVLMSSMPVKQIPRDGIRIPGSDVRYYDPALFGRQRQSALVRYDWQDASRIYVYDERGEFICEARPMKRVHPAAAHLGDDGDRQELREQIEMKQRLAKQITGPARQFIRETVIPEVLRQQERDGFKGSPVDMGNHDSRPLRIAADENRPVRLTEVERSRIEREYTELVALNEQRSATETWNVIDVDFREDADLEATEVIREPTVWETLRTMPELDRYEKDLEYEVSGMLIPREELDWMGYFERTAEYSKFRDYFEEVRAKMALFYQNR